MMLKTPALTLLEFWTFWQHWAPPLGGGTVPVRLVFTVTGTQFTPMSSAEERGQRTYPVTAMWWTD
jgi:hypothetical protein